MNLKNKKIFKSAWFWLAIIIIIRIFCVWLAAHDMPYTGASEKGMDWWAVHGGDGAGYFQSAKALLSWDFLPKASPIGFPLLLLPFLILFGTSAIQSIAVEFMIFQSIIMYAIATLLVFKLAQRMLKNKKKAGVVCGLFLVYPYLFYFIFSLMPANKIIELYLVSRFKQIMFLTIHSDALSMILMITSLIILLDVMTKKQRNKTSVVLLGFLSSAAVITRLQNAIILPFYSILLFIGKNWKRALYYAAATIPLLGWLFYINIVSNAGILQTAYRWEIGPEKAVLISWIYPLRLITYPLHYGSWLFIPMFLVLLLIGYGAYRVIKKDKNKGLLILSYFLVNTIFILFFRSTLFNVRYFLPVIPVFLIFLVVGVEYSYKLVGKTLFNRGRKDGLKY
ncbi:hypothetical protein K8R32_04620 [bacterium]|nr:hypothetical protein [bacterium]